LKALREDNRSSLRLREARRLERIFIYHRWLYVVAILLMAAVYRNLPITAIIALSLGLGAANIVAWYFSRRLDTLSGQAMLSLSIFAVDGLASWGLMLLFISEPSAIIYAIFTLIIIEGAVRFSLIGSLLTGAFFIMGLSAAWIYRVSLLDMNFDLAAYVFWVGLITLISLMVGMVVRESRKQRAYAESLSTEKTLLLERRRISNELHDTVLKSLQGLALEAHTLSRISKGNDSHPVEERARYIEEVCNSMSQEIRGVVFELHDENGNSNEGIKSQMTGIVESWSKKSDIVAELVFSGEVTELSLKLAHDLRRIVGEALANIQRHSGASRVKVSLAATGELLKLEIGDNGCGFTCATEDLYSFVRMGRLGLVSMKERVELAGGSFLISSDKRGTLISVTIPLEKTCKELTGKR
jgi:signal transduction histidine kinase